MNALHTRRSLLCAAAVAALGLSGCGFALKAPPPLGVRSVALQGFAPQSEMAAAVRRALPREVRVVTSPAQAELLISARDDRFERSVVSSTAAGQVREFRLRVSLRFSLSTGQGKLLLPDTVLEQTRDMSTIETAALAKEVEQDALLLEMRDDLARQLLRMAATVAPAR
ncbi:LPS-assembly lipoprotein LptE [Ideonella paludis]|uniref:LPS-assembly lipoprotein LptE n=1 Tax=Ideonella paludis TaxID=1233411 RepID=A0ABS5DSC5_9BURK|nr:LPS assembly lipoprotein LptE [Ideonella paludis]MBQ0934007.1 hypothetical protein [Ideonella paludis]